MPSGKGASSPSARRSRRSSGSSGRNGAAGPQARRRPRSRPNAPATSGERVDGSPDGWDPGRRGGGGRRVGEPLPPSPPASRPVSVQGRHRVFDYRRVAEAFRQRSASAPALRTYIVEPTRKQFTTLAPEERGVDHLLGCHRPRTPDRWSSGSSCKCQCQITPTCE